MVYSSVQSGHRIVIHNESGGLAKQGVFANLETRLGSAIFIYMVLLAANQASIIYHYTLGISVLGPVHRLQVDSVVPIDG